ncbi:MAG: hypothetical protein ABI402_19675 [Ferruginibacter sp.]
MKMNIRFFLVAVIALSVSFTSCNKDKTSTTTSNDNLGTHSDDQSRVSSETDAVANDVDNASEYFSAFSGKGGGTSSGVNDLILCDGNAVLDSTLTDRRITITYNGTNCSGTRTRTGVVVLTMPLGVHWRDPHAVLTVNVQNLHVTRLSDNKSININGIVTYTNSTGGRLFDLATLGTIVHEIASAGVTVTFDDGSQRIWQIAKRRTFTYDNGIVISTRGNHTEGTNTNISEWGTNRFGNAFTASITEPMIIRQDCSFRLTHGEITHDGVLGTAVVTFGLDSSGTPTGCPGLGFYYFKAVWTGVNGVVRTVIYPY